MGTLNDILRKLTYLEGTKEQIRQAIESKGVSVPTSTKFADYPGKIDQIPTESTNNGEWILQPTQQYKTRPIAVTYQGRGIKTVKIPGDERLSRRFEKFIIGGGARIGTRSLQGTAKMSGRASSATNTPSEEIQRMVQEALRRHPAIKSTYNCRHLIVVYSDGFYTLAFAPKNFQVNVTSSTNFQPEKIDSQMYVLVANVYLVYKATKTSFIQAGRYDYTGGWNNLWNGLELNKIRYSNIPIYAHHQLLWPTDPNETFGNLNRCPLL